MAARPVRSRAVDLLRKVIATQWFDRSELAEALVTTPEQLQRYETGGDPMPLERQLCLALFVIEKVPPLARAGHGLRGQLTAAMAYESGVTERHANPGRLR